MKSVTPLHVWKFIGTHLLPLLVFTFGSIAVAQDVESSSMDESGYRHVFTDYYDEAGNLVGMAEEIFDSNGNSIAYEYIPANPEDMSPEAIEQRERIDEGEEAALRDWWDEFVDIVEDFFTPADTGGEGDLWQEAADAARELNEEFPEDMGMPN